VTVPWSDAELEAFRQNQYIGERGVYADKIMRPMAKALFPNFLQSYDKENNVGENKLGPNWHAFAGDLSLEIIKVHKGEDLATLENYYTFVNWALFEATSYLSKEAYITPMEALATELEPNKWMKFFPMKVFDKLIPHMEFYFLPHIASNMRNERARLSKDSAGHGIHWKPLHRKFINVAKTNNVPYTEVV